jgi:hypothetical protein
VSFQRPSNRPTPCRSDRDEGLDYSERGSNFGLDPIRDGVRGLAVGRGLAAESRTFRYTVMR